MVVTCRPINAIMVGDRLDNDIIPAQHIGMTTILVRQGWGGKSIINRHGTRLLHR